MFDGTDFCPVDGDRLLEERFVTDEADLSRSHPVLVDQAGRLHVVAAVLRHLFLFPLPPPLNGLHAGSGFFDAARRLGHRIQPDPMFNFFLEADHEIEGGDGGEVENRVGR